MIMSVFVELSALPKSAAPNSSFRLFIVDEDYQGQMSIVIQY